MYRVALAGWHALVSRRWRGRGRLAALAVAGAANVAGRSRGGPGPTRAPALWGLGPLHFWRGLKPPAANIKRRVKGWSISNGSGEKLQKLPDPLALVMLLLAACLVYVKRRLCVAGRASSGRPLWRARPQDRPVMRSARIGRPSLG